MRLFSTEQVSKYHPDKYADQISDAILDACLKEDKNSRVACECMVKGTTVFIAGEITTKANLDHEAIVRIVHKVSSKLGYEVEHIIGQLQQQSPEIANGIHNEELGAGDQGIMFGYATNESESMLPYGFDVANRIIELLETKVGEWIKGDAKCQVTVDLDKKQDVNAIHSVLISVCHPENIPIDMLRISIAELVRPLIGNATLIINPAGSWTIGGPVADCGLTGRKIVCDQYGGYCAVGGGAFSGKDPSKVDRSGSYMARKIACDLVSKHEIDWCEVQLAYAIGMSEPVSVNVKCSDEKLNAKLEEEVTENYDLTPAGMIEHLNLLEPQYEKLAEGCHYRQH